MIASLKLDAAPYFRGWRKTSHKPYWVLWLRLFLLTPGYQLVIWLRLQRAVSHIPIVGLLLRRIIWVWTTLVFGCDIDPEAKIGSGLFLPHPTGIVIADKVVLGNDVTVLQNVTLGRSRRALEGSPIIANRVEIGAGAAVLGAITVGEGAQIGANSVVLKDVPPGFVAVGIPARLLANSLAQSIV